MYANKPAGARLKGRTEVPKTHARDQTVKLLSKYIKQVCLKYLKRVFKMKKEAFIPTRNFKVGFLGGWWLSESGQLRMTQVNGARQRHLCDLAVPHNPLPSEAVGPTDSADLWDKGKAHRPCAAGDHCDARDAGNSKAPTNLEAQKAITQAQGQHYRQRQRRGKVPAVKK